MNDYEAHLSSYDHAHKQRLRDMKAMVRDPAASSRARKAEAKADGLVSVKLAGQQQEASATTAKKGGFKKSGFKSAFAPVEGPDGAAGGKPATTTTTTAAADAPARPSLIASSSPAESDTEDEGYEVYDPRYPTD